MKRTLFLLILFLVGVLPQSFGENRRPNVIVILGDDVGYADVGFHEIVAEGVRTPNLDRLAKSGVVFTSAYSASPVCSNSRLALSTGRYPQRWGAYYYGEGGFPSDEYAIAEMMRQAGYRTMKVGKTHLNRGPKSDPMLHGFDHWLGFKQHSWDFFLLSEKDVEAYERKEEGSVKRGSTIGIGPLTRDSEATESFENTTTTEVFGQESIAFINEHSDQPFYLQLEFNAVHTLLHRAPQQLAEKYGVPHRPFDRDAAVWEYPHWDPVAQPDYKEWYSQTCHLGIADPFGRKIYLAHLELMDSVIGEIMTAVDGAGIAENTLIFFSSDNGGSHQSYADNGPLNAYKYCLMEGGIRVPMILSWPAGFQGGQTVDATVTHIDLFASLSEIAGVAPQKPLDGRSLVPLVRGEVDTVHDEPLFWDSGKQDNWVVRHGDWKLVYRGSPRTYEAFNLDQRGLVKPEFNVTTIPTGLQLYDLKSDPGETADLSSANPERVAEMEALYANWRKGMVGPTRSRSR